MDNTQENKEYNKRIKEILNKSNELEQKSMEFFQRILSYNSKEESDNEKAKEYKQDKENIENNFNQLKEKLQQIKKYITNLREIKATEWNIFNDNYLLYINKNTIELLSYINNAIKEISTIPTTDFQTELYNQKLILSIIESIPIHDDIFKYFSKLNQNYIVFGPNGAGKTSLLNEIRTNYLNDNSYVIPANKIIEFDKDQYMSIAQRDNMDLKVLFNDNIKSPNDNLTIILKEKRYKELRNQETTIKLDNNLRESITYNKIIKLFNLLGLNRKIKYNDEKNYFELYNDELSIEPYHLKYGSDGEKTVFLYIVYIMLCEKNSFIFIDEPESHLNDGLLCELFTELEKERNDMVFIYCTHNINFIESRNNIKLLYLDSYNGNNWNIKETDTYDKIDLSHLISIVGTKKNVIFVESDKEGFDYRLYSNLFDNYQIIPVSSCEKVIENCKIFNSGNFLNLNRKFYGIIDNDYKSELEMSNYRSKQIFVLTYNEIENLLLSSIILDYICENFDLNKEKENIKKEIINMTQKNRNTIISDFINKKYYKKSEFKKVSFDSTSEDLIQKLDENSLKNNSNFKIILDDFISELDKDICNKNYDDIIKKYANKGFKSCVDKNAISFNIYFKWIIDSINKDSKFKNNIKEILFESFFD